MIDNGTSNCWIANTVCTGTVPSAGCGDTSEPQCGGVCPNDENCAAVYTPFGSPCMCDVPSCGNGFYYGGAPQDGAPFGCYPRLCGTGYPTCGNDPCGNGDTCSPFEAGSGSFTGCICADPLPCNAGGFECPVGEVCRINGENAGCGSP